MSRDEYVSDLHSSRVYQHNSHLTYIGGLILGVAHKDLLDCSKPAPFLPHLPSITLLPATDVI